MAENRLCLGCRKIPFREAFAKSLTAAGRREWELRIGSLRDVWIREGCDFCTLIKLSFTSHYGAEYLESQITQQSGCELTVSQSPVDLRYDIRGQGLNGEIVPHYLELHTSQPTLERLEKKMDEFSTYWVVPKVHLMVAETENEVANRGCALYGRLVLVDAIDWVYLIKWLKMCNGRHPAPVERKVQDIFDQRTRTPGTSDLTCSLKDIKLLVVDVCQLCVIQMPKDDEYIALSYMWGKDQPVKLKKENAKQLLTPGIFNSIKPSRTIIDAMEATRRLGYRYIWVDALCITQDDEQTILANVGMIDLIYAEAALTIVAAAGTNADSGLPGVSCDIPRTQQQTKVHIDGLMIANMLDSHLDAINFSTWNTRGWTYQERLLSLRLLVFTEAQVYYTCSQGCQFQEDIHLDDGFATMATPDPRYQIDMQNEVLFDIYANAVAEYTYRQLTNQHDKIRAFAGFLNTLVEPFRSSFFFGLPSIHFEIGLLWTPVAACARTNKKLPSWSWASWDGPVRFTLRDGMANFCECTVSQVDIETTYGVRLSSKVNRLSQRSNGLDGYGVENWRRHIDEETLVIYYSLTDSKGKEYPYRYPSPHRAINKEDVPKLAMDNLGLLKVTGLCASFVISSQHSRLRTLFSTCKEGRHEQCNLAILDVRNQVAGTVFVDGRAVPQLRDKAHRFLAVARSTLNRMDDDPSWDEATSSFRCWTHLESGKSGDSDSDDESLINEIGIEIANREAFDVGKFNEHVFWPVFDVLLLKEQDDGMVERLGIGKIHVDAFLPIAENVELVMS